MPRVQEHPEHPEGGRKYGAFQTEIYKNGILNNKLPTVTTDPNKLEQQARHHLGARSFNYVSGGAGERATMDANRLAFRQWKVGIFSAPFRAGSKGLIERKDDSSNA
ncbi:MAG: hypothetical protein Q9219_002134 [cf. Caloplaca sp. 3 TL-2023]